MFIRRERALVILFTNKLVFVFGNIWEVKFLGQKVAVFSQKVCIEYQLYVRFSGVDYSFPVPLGFVIFPYMLIHVNHLRSDLAVPFHLCLPALAYPVVLPWASGSKPTHLGSDRGLSSITVFALKFIFCHFSL